MRKIGSLGLSMLILLSVLVIPFSISVLTTPTLVIVEWSIDQVYSKVVTHVFPAEDNSMQNPDYALLGYKWYSTANYWINPSNNYGFSQVAVVTAITTSAKTWDSETSFAVFSYVGMVSKQAGKYDHYNVVSWGSYRAGVIAVTYIWSIGTQIVETDLRLNTFYTWSLSGAAKKMDVKNIAVHEFGHWCGLADLYGDADYWLTMYGYSNYGEIYKQTLGYGDIKGLKAVYGL